MFAFKTAKSCPKSNASNPSFNFLLRKFTLNSLLEKIQCFKITLLEKSKWDPQKCRFLCFFIEIMIAFLLDLLIENFKPECYCFEIVWCWKFEWIWKDLMFDFDGYNSELYQTTFHSKNRHNTVGYSIPQQFLWFTNDL